MLFASCDLMKKLGIATLAVTAFMGLGFLLREWHFALLACVYVAAILSIPLAGIMKKGDIVFFVLGIVFLTQGSFLVAGIPGAWVNASSFLSSVHETLRLLSFLGLPMAMLYLSISFLWSKRGSVSKAVELVQVGVCVVLFVSWVFLDDAFAGKGSVWPDLALFTAAGLATSLGVFNFVKAKKLTRDAAVQVEMQ